MSFYFFLVRKFLYAPNITDTFVSFISWVSILGVSLGTLALIVVTSVFNGFQMELRHVITQLYGDVVVLSAGRLMHQSQAEDLMQDMGGFSDQLVHLEPSLNAELMVVSDHRIVGGLLEATENRGLQQKIIKGHFPLEADEVALGYGLADKLNVTLGDTLKLVLPFQQQHEAKVIGVKVCGIAQLGMYEYDSKLVLMDLSMAQQHLQKKKQISKIAVWIKDPQKVGLTVQGLSDYFSDHYRVKDTTQFNKNLFYVIELQKKMVGIILTAIVVVAAFNIISTLMMLIHDKTYQMSILRTMGLSAPQCFWVFCCIGGLIGSMGVVTGVLGGIFCCFLLKHFQFIHLPREIYNLGFLPVMIRWEEVGFIVCCALFICLGATFFPALKVSRQSLLKGLQT